MSFEIFRLETIPLSWKNLEEAIQSATKMINDHERFLGEVKRTSGQGLQGIRSEYKTLEVTTMTNICRKRKKHKFHL